MTDYRILFIVLLAMFCAGCIAPHSAIKEIDSSLPYEEVPVPDQMISEEFPKPDTWAKFPGGQDNLQSYFMQNTRIPEAARIEGYSSRLIVTYEITETGDVENVNVPLSPHDSISEHFINVIQNMEKWQPAQLNGSPVRQQYIYTSYFR